ncbi:MAG TPA: zinc ribbon domain-containing protein, partial [Methanoregula sp.]|nr:zinc ribbon domain-containing protein [Methanoregula sp.]
MGQQFCTACGAKLNEGMRFCENCGAAVEPVLPVAAAASPEINQVCGASPGTPPGADPGKFPVKIIAGIVIVLIIAAIAVLVALPKLQDSSLPGMTGPQTPAPTPYPTPAPTPVSVETPAEPVPPLEPFPDALALRELFYFNNESKYASRATVYRAWMNETYQWHNDMDNRYYIQKPKAGNKYLLIFVNIENIGSDGFPYPKSNRIVVHNGGNLYRVDTSHYLPNKAGNRDATAIEIFEIETFSDYFRQEYVEDYGYSHGTTQDFVFPG